MSIKRVCIATSLEKNLLTVAMADPLLFSLVQDLEFQTGYRIKQVVATAAEILDSIQKSYPDKALTKAAPAAGLVHHARPKTGAGEQPAETSLARRAEDDVFEPVAGLKEPSETAPIVDSWTWSSAAPYAVMRATCTSSLWRKGCSSGIASTAFSRRSWTSRSGCTKD